MNNNKCPECGLVNFATAESCKRCETPLGGEAAAGVGASGGGGGDFAGALASDYVCPLCGRAAEGGFCRSCQAWVEPPRFAMPGVYEPYGRASSGAGGRRALVICVAVAAACTLFYAAGRSMKWFDSTALYAELIRDSEQFGAPVTVRVNREPIPSPAEPRYAPLGDRHTPAGTANGAAHLLAHLGLLSIEKSTTEKQVELGGGVPFLDVRTGENRELRPLAVTHRTDRLDIRLTELGRQESADWEETEEKPHNFPGGGEAAPITWWRVPLGRRELVRVEAVGDVNKVEGKRSVEVKFVWRWRTNKLGESFDTGSDSFGSLPQHVRDRLARTSWDSRKDFYGVATLEGTGGKWAVAKIKFAGGEEGATAPGG